MKIQEAINYIHQHSTDVLEADNQSRHLSTPKGYVCPICGSGSHSPNGTGMTTKDGIHFTCWTGCFNKDKNDKTKLSADIIDILALKDGYGNESPFEKLKHACKVFNITLDPPEPQQQTTEPVQAPTRAQSEPLKAKQNDQEEDYTDEIYTAMQYIDECDYLTNRGISKELQKRMRIGFDPQWQNPKNPKAPQIPALIIPTYGNSAYTARDMRENIGKSDRYRKAGKPHLYNTFALYSDSNPVFVVEGEIDALSIMELGFKAVAIGSTDYRNLLIEEITENNQLKANIPLLILALDNDNAGANATNDLCKKLQELGADYHLPKSSEIYGDYKDANDCLTSDREQFKARLTRLNKSKEELYNDNSALNALSSFLEDIENNRNAEPISTGFENLDHYLDGGLYAGLYVLGAISSLGKTSLIMQIVDEIAKAGHDVLIFSLEMARKELIAKSISRLTFKGMKAGQQTDKIARSTRDLLSNKNRNNREQMQAIKDAMSAYSKYASNIFIVEGLGDVNIDRIKNTLANHIVCRKKTPVVIIDYLQIIAPYDMRATDKQNTDRAVLELKRISRDFNTPVFAISSFNRDNYKDVVNMASFKESGAIEYSCDVLMGLQLKGVEEILQSKSKTLISDIEALKDKNPREIVLKILKNRNGQLTNKNPISMDFYARYNDFEES